MLPQWLGGAAILGVLAAGWSKIRWVLLKITSIAVVRVKISGRLAEAIDVYLWRHYRRSPFGGYQYSSKNTYIRPLDLFAKVGYEVVGSEALIFWRKLTPILVGSISANNENGGGTDLDSENVGKTLTFIRGTLNTDKFIQAAIDEWNALCRTEQNIQTRFCITKVYGAMRHRGHNGEDASAAVEAVGGGHSKTFWSSVRLLKWTPDELDNTKRSDNELHLLALPPEVEEMIKEIKYWLTHKHWYRERSIPWKRGWLLYGVPGSGKTSVARALAHDFDLPVWVFDCATLTNKELSDAWRRMCGNTPCIALFEDIDVVFDGRKNITAGLEDKLSFDQLLSCLDGIEECDGVLSIITTNCPEKLDSALGVCIKDGEVTRSTRPGRVDRIFGFGPLDKEGRIKIAKRIIAEYPDLQTELVNQGDGDVGAQFQERCTQAALSKLWSVAKQKDDLEQQLHKRGSTISRSTIESIK